MREAREVGEGVAGASASSGVPKIAGGARPVFLVTERVACLLVSIEYKVQTCGVSPELTMLKGALGIVFGVYWT